MFAKAFNEETDVTDVYPIVGITIIIVNGLECRYHTYLADAETHAFSCELKYRSRDIYYQYFERM